MHEISPGPRPHRIISDRRDTQPPILALEKKIHGLKKAPRIMPRALLVGLPCSASLGTNEESRMESDSKFHLKA